MFTSWNIADSLLTSATDGHQFWEPKLLSQELKRRGKAVRLLGHKSIAAANFPDAESVPLFPLYFTEPNSRDPTWGYLENFIVQNRGFEEALVTFPASLLRDAIMLFPNVTERQLLGIFRWIGLLEVRNLPGIAIVLSALQNWGTTNPSIEVYRKLWSECPPETKERLRLCARTEITAQKFEETLGTRPHVLPSVLAPTAHEVAAARECAASASDPVSVVFVGGARRERGAL